jgi:hypothetical protein
VRRSRGSKHAEQCAIARCGVLTGWRKAGSKQTRFANRMTAVADYVSERDLQKRGEGCCLRRWVMSGRQASEQHCHMRYEKSERRGTLYIGVRL